VAVEVDGRRIGPACVALGWGSGRFVERSFEDVDELLDLEVGDGLVGMGMWGSERGRIDRGCGWVIV